MTRLFLLIFAAALFPTAQAVVPAPDGGYPGGNTAEGTNALFSLTTGAEIRAMGFAALESNPANADKAVAGWIWKATGNLNTARAAHTATSIQNGIVLLAGGFDIFAVAKAEVGGPPP